MKTSSLLFALLLGGLLVFGAIGCEDPEKIPVAPEETVTPIPADPEPEPELEPEPEAPEPEMVVPKPGPLIPETKEN